MRRAALLCLLAALPLAAQVSQYKQISFNWDYAANLPVCGTALISCFAGFQMSDLLSGHVLITLPPSARSWVFVPGGGGVQLWQAYVCASGAWLRCDRPSCAVGTGYRDRGRSAAADRAHSFN